MRCVLRRLLYIKKQRYSKGNYRDTRQLFLTSWLPLFFFSSLSISDIAAWPHPSLPPADALFFFFLIDHQEWEPYLWGDCLQRRQWHNPSRSLCWQRPHPHKPWAAESRQATANSDVPTVSQGSPRPYVHSKLYRNLDPLNTAGHIFCRSSKRLLFANHFLVIGTTMWMGAAMGTSQWEVGGSNPWTNKGILAKKKATQTHTGPYSLDCPPLPGVGIATA